MLVLTRRKGEVICIGDEVRVVVAEVHGQTVRIGVEASPEVVVDREEVRARKRAFREPAGASRSSRPALARIA